MAHGSHEIFMWEQTDKVLKEQKWLKQWYRQDIFGYVN